jgi:tRNA pseudouridine55 synthase
VSRAPRASKRFSRKSRTASLAPAEKRSTKRGDASEPAGLLLIDKPAGFTSHDIVAIARGATGTRRIGHTGTLDPFATGLLVLLVGKATRLAQYVDGEPKVYEATIVFGRETATDDLTGEIVRTAGLPAPDAVDGAIARLTGDIDQLPPAFSAKQTGGVRAYDAARKGRPLELKPARISVHGWDVLHRDQASLSARITCSGGTYVRALGRDLGRLSGSAAHLTELRRMASGPFFVDAAVTLEALRLRQYTLLPMNDGVRSLTKRELTADEAARVAHGNAVPASGDQNRAALVTASGELAAIADRRDDHWQPIVVFASE